MRPCGFLSGVYEVMYGGLNVPNARLQFLRNRSSGVGVQDLGLKPTIPRSSGHGG